MRPTALARERELHRKIVRGLPRLPRVKLPKQRPIRFRRPNNRHYRRKLRQMRGLLSF